MSSPPNTQRRAAPPRRGAAPQPAEPPPRSGLDLGTLVVAAISAVIAATVVSRLWQAGTVMATAMTPVVVTLIKEALDRPARRVSSIATRAAAPPLARATRAVAEPPPEAYAPPPPLGPDPGLSEMRVYRRERANPGRRWKLALVTGLLAFVIGVAVLTLPELVAGHSVLSSSHDTTIFGGHRSTSASKTSTPTDKQTTTGQSTTTTGTQSQTTTTQTDTTTTAPNGQQTTTQTAPAAPAPTQSTPTTTQPPAQTQPPPATP